MKNLTQLMQQAQQMQAKMAEAQKKLDEKIVEGQSGGGLVKVVMTCKNDLVSLSIDPSLVVADEKEVLEDLIVAACNDARTKAQKLVEEEMGKVTGGLQLPGGMKLPF